MFILLFSGHFVDKGQRLESLVITWEWSAFVSIGALKCFVSGAVFTAR